MKLMWDRLTGKNVQIYYKCTCGGCIRISLICYPELRRRKAISLYIGAKAIYKFGTSKGRKAIHMDIEMQYSIACGTQYLTGHL